MFYLFNLSGNKKVNRKAQNTVKQRTHAEINKQRPFGSEGVEQQHHSQDKQQRRVRRFRPPEFYSEPLHVRSRLKLENAFPDQQNAEKQSENFRLREYIRRADNKNTRENVDDSPQKTETNHRIQKIIYYLHQTADNEHGSRKITNGTFRCVGHGKQTNAENKIKQ